MVSLDFCSGDCTRCSVQFNYSKRQTWVSHHIIMSCFISKRFESNLSLNEKRYIRWEYPSDHRFISTHLYSSSRLKKVDRLQKSEISPGQYRRDEETTTGCVPKLQHTFFVILEVSLLILWYLFISSRPLASSFLGLIAWYKTPQKEEEEEKSWGFLISCIHVCSNNF